MPDKRNIVDMLIFTALKTSLHPFLHTFHYFNLCSCVSLELIFSATVVYCFTCLHILELLPQWHGMRNFPIIVHYRNPYQLWVFVVDVYGQKTEVSQRVNGNKSYSALYLSYCDLVIQLLLYALLLLWKL